VNFKSSNLLTFLIIAATSAVVCLQVLLSIKNYNEKKMVLKNEVEFSLDKAIEMYYLEDATEEFLTIIDKDPNRPFKSFVESIQFDSIAHQPIDSVNIVQEHRSYRVPVSAYQIVKGRIKADSIASLPNKGNVMYFPLKKNGIQMKELNKRLTKELSKREIVFDYAIQLTIKDSVHQSLKFSNVNTFTDTILAQSIFLPESSVLSLYFSNPTKIIWKRGWYEIVLSFLFSVFIITCLIYLLHVFILQKRNIEVRNDFVSNITHEFKTPIATATSALEAMQKFNEDSDKEKKKKYLSMAQQSISQLNDLSEKILETSSMENNNLTLQLKSENIIRSLEKIISKHQYNTTDRSMLLKTSSSLINADVDLFYFESALNSIIDNAVKYGGTSITIDLKSTDQAMIIEIMDNGTGIDKSHANRIFEKYYRIPNGNVHNNRGYGVGLYHAQKIIESHGGKLLLISNHPAIFQIKLPHE
jgi:signal transduction histidine kinase